MLACKAPLTLAASNKRQCFFYLMAWLIACERCERMIVYLHQVEGKRHHDTTRTATAEDAMLEITDDEWGSWSVFPIYRGTFQPPPPVTLLWWAGIATLSTVLTVSYSMIILGLKYDDMWSLDCQLCHLHRSTTSPIRLVRSENDTTTVLYCGL